MDKEKLITDITKLALDFWTMNLHNGTFESNLRTLINKHEEAINYSRCCGKLKVKEKLTFEEWRVKNKYNKKNGYWVNKQGVTIEFMQMVMDYENYLFIRNL